jgi:hypothetical protein
MKIVMSVMLIVLGLLINILAMSASAQSSTVSCRVNGNTPHTGFCTSSAAAQAYSVANILNLGPGNFSVHWNSPAVGNCTNNSTVCIYSVNAVQNQTDYTTTAVITNLDTGAVTTASAIFHSQATCYEPPFLLRRGYWYYC